jgi:transposase
MARRYELTDQRFALIESVLPPNRRRCGQWNDHRTTLNDIFWILHNGAQWRELPGATASGRASTTASTAGVGTGRLTAFWSGFT